MKELIKRGYTQDNQRYVKYIGSYKIELFPAKEDGYYLRRIILVDKTVDVKKVNIHNMEKDTPFQEVLKNRALATRLTPRLRDDLSEIHLERKPKIKLTGTQDTKENQPGYLEDEIKKPEPELHINKK